MIRWEAGRALPRPVVLAAAVAFLWVALLATSTLLARFGSGCFAWPMLVFECVLDSALCGTLWLWLDARGHADRRGDGDSEDQLPGRTTGQFVSPCPESLAGSTNRPPCTPQPPETASPHGLRLQLESVRLELQMAREELACLKERPAASNPTCPPTCPPMRFRVGPMLAQGASCIVSLGLNLDTGGFFACKQMRTLPKEEEEGFRSEVRSWAAAPHPNLIQSLGCGPGGVFFEELMYPGSLRWVLTAFGALEEPLVQRYTRQVLQGLA